MSKTTNITVPISGNAIQDAHTKKTLLAFANLPADDQDRISQLITNPKALKSLKSNWAAAKLMFG